MQLLRTDFKPSGQKNIHISLCFVIVYVKLFLATGFEVLYIWQKWDGESTDKYNIYDWFPLFKQTLAADVQ